MFAPGFGADTISQFDAVSDGSQDLLDLAGLGITALNFAASVTITDLGADTLVTIDVNGQGTVTGAVTLLGVNGAGTNVITQQDFLLA